MTEEIKLAPCPCGKTPQELTVTDSTHGMAFAYGACCNEWFIEFDACNTYLGTMECYQLAREAWNNAPRSTQNAE